MLSLIHISGTLTGSKTYAKRQKDVDGMLERGELLTMEEFFEAWTCLLYTSRCV